MRLGEGAEPHECGRHRQAAQLGEAQDLGGGVRADHAPAQVQHRPLGLVDRLRGGADLPHVAFDRGLVARQVEGVGLVVGGLAQGDVDRDVDDHRARPAGRSDVEGLVQHLRQIGRVFDQVGVLHDRQRDAGHVRLLEGVGADEVAAHLPRDGDEGHRVEVGRGDAGDQIGGAGAAGGRAHADLAGGARVAVSGVRGALFVAHQHVTQVLGVVEGVVERDGDAPGESEEDVATFVLQSRHERSRALHLLV